MKVLVTGATGFLGCHTVAALARAGHTVRVLTRSPRDVDTALGAVGVAPGTLKTRAGDVTDPAAVENALVGCDAVVHAAAVVALDPRKASAAVTTSRGPRR